MKKILLFCILLMNIMPVFAVSKLANDNVTTFALTTARNTYLIQNIYGKAVQIDFFIDQYVAGTTNPSDNVYAYCNNKFTLIKPGTGIICDVSYPGYAQLFASPTVRGATGRFSIIY